MKNIINQGSIKLAQFLKNELQIMRRNHLQCRILLIAAMIIMGGSRTTFASNNTDDVTEIKLYSPTPLTVNSKIFSVRVKAQGSSSWQSIPVNFLYSVHYARLATSGALTFEISVPDNIDNCGISPKRLGIQYDINDKKLIFTLSQPRHLVVKINNLEYLCLLIDSLQSDDPSPNQNVVVNVKDFVSDVKGSTDQTDNLQKAIDYLYDTSGKNILFFPPGIYKFKTLYFINRTKPVTVFIADGALLLKALRQSPSEEESAIWIAKSKNLTLKGHGVIDCNGKANGERWDKINQGCTMPFWIMDCENICIRDILMRNSSMWSMQVHYCKNFTLSNYKVINPPESGVGWTDGVNISLGDSVLVENCFAYCTDDIFATGQHQYETKKKVNPVYRVIAADTKNFTIRNLFGLTSSGNMTRFGCQSMGYSVKNYRFEDCDFMNFDSVTWEGADISFWRLQASIKDKPGRIDGIYDNIAFVNCSWENDDNVANIRFVGDATFGKLELINCTFEYKTGAILSNIEELYVRNLKSGGKIRQTPEEAGFELTNVKKIDWSGIPYR